MIRQFSFFVLLFSLGNLACASDAQFIGNDEVQGDGRVTRLVVSGGIVIEEEVPLLLYRVLKAKTRALKIF